MVLKITERQRGVLLAIRQLSTGGPIPSVRELAAQLGGVSTSTTDKHLRALERKGFVLRQVRKARSVVLTEAGAAELGEEGLVPADLNMLRIPDFYMGGTGES